MATALLVILALLVLANAWRDQRDYARFKAHVDTSQRQRFFARWLVQAFVIFTLGALGGLALLGEWRAIVEMPPAFAAVATGILGADASPGFLPVLALGGMVGLVVGCIAGAYVARRTPVVLGDIAPLLPRSRAEYRWLTLLSINAGIGEELFFRLFLPLVLTDVLGDARVAIAMAIAAFAFIHLYQGWTGVAGTAVLGALMTFLYLATGSLAWPIVAHILVDLRTLVVQPWLAARWRREPGLPPG